VNEAQNESFSMQDVKWNGSEDGGRKRKEKG
jgi:hypothetical protein